MGDLPEQPHLECQIELRDADERFIGRIDLGWRLRSSAPSTTATHNPRHWAQDEPRHPRYKAIGWEVDRVDKYDPRAGHGRLGELLERRLGRTAA